MTAVLMSGGKSSRMDFQPKQLLLFRGETFQARILRQLKGFGECAVSGVMAVPGYPLWRDYHTGIGPIGGIEAALRNAGADRVFITACDTPLLTADCIDWLIGSQNASDTCLVPVSGGREHPMCAVYAKEMLPALEAQIAAGRYRLRDFVRNAGARYVTVPDCYAQDFLNVNTPEMLEILERSERGGQNHE